MTPYQALVERFKSTGTPFRELSHAPAAAAADYHSIVGSRLAQQAKAIFLRRYRRDGGKDYLVCAIPGDRSVDLEGSRRLVTASRLRLATPDELQRVTGCRFGELPPVGSIFGVELVLDDRLLAEAELYFNAGRLDRSFIVEPADLVALERPIILRTDSQPN